MMLLIVALQCAGILVLLIILLHNSIVVEDLAAFPETEQGEDLLSLLIPARNEADRIGTTLPKIAARGYRPSELLVLDDRSEDDTMGVLQRLQTNTAPFRILEGSPLPDGFVGKPHACQQLAEASNGSVLLFLDADVTCTATAPGRCVAARRHHDAGMVSVFPEQECRTLAERLAVPLMDLALYTTLPLGLVNRCAAPALSAATGQCLLVSRTEYFACGGHRSVATEVVEDLALARRLKGSGARLLVLSGKGLIRCRMYRSHHEVVRGFGKNLFAFAGYRIIPFLLALTVTFFLLLLPILLLPFTPLALIPVALVVIMRALHAHRFGYPIFEAVVLHPLSIVYALGIGVYSIYLTYSGTITWRGRSLDTRRTTNPTYLRTNR